MTKCAYCEYNDGVVYTSDPPKYRCTVTGEYHLALDDCNVEFAPIKHGRWIKITQEWADYAEYFCSCCGRKIKAPFTLNPAWAFPYCHCGAKMDEVEDPYNADQTWAEYTLKQTNEVEE